MELPITETKENGGCQGLGRGANGKLLNGDRASVWEDEKFLERDGGDGCRAM